MSELIPLVVPALATHDLSTNPFGSIRQGIFSHRTHQTEASTSHFGMFQPSTSVQNDGGSCKFWFRLVLLYTHAKTLHASFSDLAGRPRTVPKSMSDLSSLVLRAIARLARPTNPFLFSGKPGLADTNPQHGASRSKFGLVWTPKIH